MKGYDRTNAAFKRLEAKVEALRKKMPPVKDDGNFRFFPAVDADTGLEVFKIAFIRFDQAFAYVPAASMEEAKAEAVRMWERGEIALTSSSAPMVRCDA